MVYVVFFLCTLSLICTKFLGIFSDVVKCEKCVKMREPLLLSVILTSVVPELLTRYLLV